MGKLQEHHIGRLSDHLGGLHPTFDRGLFKDAMELYSDSLVVDLHLDSLLSECLFDYDLLERHRLEWRPRSGVVLDRILKIFEPGRHRPMYNHSDVPRMVEGGVDGAVFGIHWWPRSLLRMSDPYVGIQHQFEALEKAAGASDQLVRVRTPAELVAARSAGRTAAMTGVEGLTCLGLVAQGTREQRLERIAAARREQGIAYLTLNHLSATDAAKNGWTVLPWDRDAETTIGEPLDPFGAQVVGACNDAGVILDLSHTNKQGILDACKVSRAPVIASHSGLQSAMSPRSDKYPLRLLHDESAVAIVRTGGLIGLILCPEFLSDPEHDPAFGSLATVAKHAAAITKLVAREVGPEAAERCCAIGTDFDGWIPSIPREMDGIDHLPLLAYFLKAEGLTDEQVRGLLGDNFRRVWEAVVSMAKTGG
jgi:membrane dipeptidase